MLNGNSKDMEERLYPDVLLIHLCVSDAMMLSFAHLIVSGWRAIHKETKIADTFNRSHIDDPSIRCQCCQSSWWKMYPIIMQRSQLHAKARENR